MITNLNKSYIRYGFMKYLNNAIINHNALDVVDLLINNFQEVYIFSGIIRNFFIGADENLTDDLDIVVQNNTLEPTDKIICDLIRDYNLRVYDIECIKSSSSYSKIRIYLNPSYKLDVWDIEKSLGFNKDLPISERNASKLPSSAFLNSQAIIFDLKKKCFIYDKNFVEFIHNRQISIIGSNPLNNSYMFKKIIKYFNIYNLSLSKNTVEWMISQSYKMRGNIIDIGCKKDILKFFRYLYFEHNIKIPFIDNDYKILWNNVKFRIRTPFSNQKRNVIEEFFF